VKAIGHRRRQRRAGADKKFYPRKIAARESGLGRYHLVEQWRGVNMCNAVIGANSADRIEVVRLFNRTVAPLTK
jgi:hypothetical protein